MIFCASANAMFAAGTLASNRGLHQHFLQFVLHEPALRQPDADVQRELLPAPAHW